MTNSLVWEYEIRYVRSFVLFFYFPVAGTELGSLATCLGLKRSQNCKAVMMQLSVRAKLACAKQQPGKEKERRSGDV